MSNFMLEFTLRSGNSLRIHVQPNGESVYVDFTAYDINGNDIPYNDFENPLTQDVARKYTDTIEELEAMEWIYQEAESKFINPDYDNHGMMVVFRKALEDMKFELPVVAVAKKAKIKSTEITANQSAIR